MSQGSRYKKVRPPEGNRRKLLGPKPRKNFTATGGVVCRECFKLQNELDLLREEIKSLKASLKYGQESTSQEVANAHTPSSKINYKANSKEENQLKVGGAKPGHKGHGRKKVTEQEGASVTNFQPPMMCSDCQCELSLKDVRERTVIESQPIIAKKVIYRVRRGQCPECSKIYNPSLPVLPKNLYGNSLIAQTAVCHYVHGMTMGKTIEMFGDQVSLGGLVDSFHRLGKIAKEARPFLVSDYRKALVKHADETGWRTDGRSGYAWIFTTPMTTIFDFKNTRAASVAHNILGADKLPGVLVVDRYGGYNQMPVNLQYCYAHLLREVQKLEEEFNEEKAVVDFATRFSSLLSRAMKLRKLDISEKEYLLQAKEIKESIEKMVYSSQKHMGVQRIQQIFREKEHRLYHWVESREVPAENNFAERELRPTVIARKASFGSQSDAGAETRSHIMSLLYTVKKRVRDKSIEEWLKDALDKIAADPSVNIAALLPPVMLTPNN